MYIVHNMHTCLICFPTIRPVQAAAIQSAAMCTKATGEEEEEGCYYYLWSWAFVASSKAIVHIRSSIADNERRAAFFLGCLRQGQSDSAEFTTAAAIAVEKTHRERRPPSNVLCYQRTTKTKKQGLSIEENQLLPRTHVRGFAPPLLKAGGYTTTDTFTNFFYHVLVHTRRH